MQMHALLKLFSSQEDCKKVMGLCREKIRRAEAQLELNLTTVVKDSTKMFLQIYRQQKENFHHLLNTGVNSNKD